MSKLTAKLFIPLIFVALLSSAYAVEGVLVGMPDPTIIAADNAYYIFATGTGLPIYRSTDLVRWQEIDRVFDKPVPDWAKTAIPQTEGIWAPHILKMNGKYYAYYSVSSFGSQRSVTGVAVSKTLDPASPDYGWTDLGLVVESDPQKDDFNAIDIAVYQDIDNKAYAVWGSHWGGVKFAEVDSKTGKFVRKADHYPSVAARPDVSSGAIEGAFLIRRGEYYYLFVSFDACCNGAESTYKVMVGRAESVAGPYLDFKDKPMAEGGGTLVLANNDNWRGPGHNSVLQSSKGDLIVHHTYDTCNLDKHRILQIRPMYWTEDDWPVVGEPVTAENPFVADAARISAAQLVGSWRMSNDYGQERIVDLIPGGKIANQRRASWSVSDNRLMLTWPDGNNEQTTWVDRCVIEPSEMSFIGRNQNGAIVRGTKICK